MDKDAKNQPQGTQDPEEADVEGHMNPHLAMDISAARQQEMIARADRDRQVRSAAGTGRDGGMLDKIRRFARREG